MFDRSRRKMFTRRRTPELQRLPWVIDEAVFTDSCTRCNKCISACESQIIVKGDGGFPTIDFNYGECTFCYRCAEACPESLFHPQTDNPWELKAQINQSCLAHNKIECRSCGDMCEVQAIRFRLQAGGVAQPALKADDCTGCGACLSVCPTSAITMVINEVEEK
ncbi:ferredoxin-type protein NapF [Photobacterium lipolyticum]|uniref:Ferredoxin-type protein NapF n=1 Tax=Photobacterium lipolyticum TaxID=266810 RepID=A0A2T3N5B4_9GAMM|nr:ferredoxin-type protein NapF [Photobacterium lipolyticum]PSW07650.1 ferredoxin-type protein NapF [Photobacterium lipolyticum]